ncbi:MAG: PKD domain-containing protein [Cyclobacteriaceae bacterium]
MKNMLNNAMRKTILMMSLLASMAVLISCGEDDEPGTDPDPDPATVNAGFSSSVDPLDSYKYTFTNSSVILGIEDLSADYAWDFGGDGTSTDESPVHTFSAAGEFEVKLTVTAADGTEGTAMETITVTAPKNKFVSIFDQYGTGNEKPGGGNDNGELRLQLADSIRTGRLTYNYRLTVEGIEGYPNVAGNSTTSDYSICELRLKSDPLSSHGWREGAGADDSHEGEMFPAPKAGEWVAVEVSWVCDGVNYPKYTVVIDGQTVVSNVSSATDGGEGDEPGHLEATKDGVKNFQWKYGSSSAIETEAANRFHVDDIKIYSSDSGSEVIAFEDDFQAYDVGFAWTVDDVPTTYHENSIDAEVLEED